MARPRGYRLLSPHVPLDRDQGNDSGIDQMFAGVLEIDRHPVAIDRLHLPGAPVGLCRVTHVRAGNDSTFHDAS